MCSNVVRSESPSAPSRQTQKRFTGDGVYVGGHITHIHSLERTDRGGVRGEGWTASGGIRRREEGECSGGYLWNVDFAAAVLFELNLEVADSNAL